MIIGNAGRYLASPSSVFDLCIIAAGSSDEVKKTRYVATFDIHEPVYATHLHIALVPRPRNEYDFELRSHVSVS